MKLTARPMSHAINRMKTASCGRSLTLTTEMNSLIVQCTPNIVSKVAVRRVSINGRDTYIIKRVLDFADKREFEVSICANTQYIPIEVDSTVGAAQNLAKKSEKFQPYVIV